MGISNIVVVRHSRRIDKENPCWPYTSATPYDPPLAPGVGAEMCYVMGSEIRSLFGRKISSETVVVHSSPYLRCIQTAEAVARSLGMSGIKCRIDSVFGEWLDPEYFDDGAWAPPNDQNQGLILSSTEWLKGKNNLIVERAWDPNLLGGPASFGESFGAMQQRFNKGLDNLIAHYESQPGPPKSVILVTHGAGCNVILNRVLQTPGLMDVMGVAQYYEVLVGQNLRLGHASHKLMDALQAELARSQSRAGSLLPAPRGSPAMDVPLSQGFVLRTSIRSVSPGSVVNSVDQPVEPKTPETLEEPLLVDKTLHRGLNEEDPVEFDFRLGSNCL